MSALVAEAADGAETDPESAATPVGSVAKAVLANGDGTGDDGGGSKVAYLTKPLHDSPNPTIALTFNLTLYLILTLITATTLNLTLTLTL